MDLKTEAFSSKQQLLRDRWIFFSSFWMLGLENSTSRNIFVLVYKIEQIVQKTEKGIVLVNNNEKKFSMLLHRYCDNL